MCRHSSLPHRLHVKPVKEVTESGQRKFKTNKFSFGALRRTENCLRKNYTLVLATLVSKRNGAVIIWTYFVSKEDTQQEQMLF